MSRCLLYVLTIIIMSIIFFATLNIQFCIYDICLLTIPALFLLEQCRKQNNNNAARKYKYHRHAFLFSQYIDLATYIVIAICAALLAILLETRFLLKGGLILLFSYYTSNNYLRQSIGFKLMNIYVKPSYFILIGKIYYVFLSASLLQSFLFLKIIVGVLIGLDSLFIILKDRPFLYLVCKVNVLHKE